MLISGINSCTSCILHNPEKIIEIFINIEKKSYFSELIEQNKLNNKTRLLKKSDFSKLGIKNNEKSLIVVADQITDQIIWET